ncbi:MAG: hypothetical protein ABFS43_13085 [Thermodesulfobacteriota bacterium]
MEKWLFFTGAFQAMRTNPLGLIMVVLAILSTLLTLVYTFVTGIRIFFGPLHKRLAGQNIKDPPLSMTLPLLLLALVALALGVFPQPILDLLQSVIGT